MTITQIPPLTPVARRTDAELLAGCSVDPHFYREFFERHVRPVRRYAASRVGAQLADDVAAEVFATAYRHRERVHGSDARSWLLGIATNLMREHRRAEARRLRMLERVAGSVRAPTSEDAGARTERATLDPDLTAALARLRPGDREVLLLVALGELAPGELHRVLGIAPIAARVRLSRARRRLRDELATSTERRPT